MSQTEVPEGVVNLAHALVETQHLRAWFYALERLPVSFREAAFSEMAAQMRSVGEDSSLADAVASLANPKMYQSVLETVRERVDETMPNISSKSPRSRVSAGLLMFRRKGGALELLLVHPGGPFFQRKDDAAWTIPKGEAAPGENLLARAQIEFEEELGIRPHGNWIELGSIKQKGGKTVHAWAFEGDLPDAFQLKSNTFDMEWPPRSGKLKQFPEIDHAEFFGEEIARRKMNPAQMPFLDRLRAALHGTVPS